MTLAAVAVNWAEAEPEDTETEEGTVRLALPELSETVVAESTFAERVTLQVVDPAPVIVAGLQATTETTIGGLTDS